VDDRLYATEPETLLAVVGELNDKLKCVMLFGHNPEFSELAHRLSSDIALLPTCAVAQFTFETKSWATIGDVQPANVVLDYPKKE
jgi:phosphohistidine phosphatase